MTSKGICITHRLSLFTYTLLYCIGLSRYIAITDLSIIAVFVQYLRHFLIDLDQIYRHSSVPETRLRDFFELLSSSGLGHGAAATFFVITCNNIHK